MKRLLIFLLLGAFFAPMVISAISCERKVEVKQEITDDGQGTRKETTVRKFH